VTGYGVDYWSSVPGRAEIFLYSTESIPSLWPTQPPIQWVLWTLFPDIKQPQCEADHWG